MLCAVIKTLDFQKIKRANKEADLVELRLDLMGKLPFKTICELREACKIPVIFKGGEDILDFLSCVPDYVDLPKDAPQEHFEQVKKTYPTIKRICSWHDFNGTPSSFEPLFERSAEIYKIATMAKSALDSLRMLNFVKNCSRPVIGLCMGETGILTRILAPVVGCPFMYAPMEENEKTAPGQLLLEELKTIYHFKTLNRETALYGLIGDPVDKSRSHRTHNFAFRKLGLNAVYVKIPLSKEELKDFFLLSRELGFQGLSVTMPLKEAVLPFLTKVHDNCGAINTVKIEGEKLSGWNTDGKGALEAIEKKDKVRGKHLVILGAGGCARGVASEALKRGARVTLLNRNFSRAERLAKELSCEAASLENFPVIAKKGYDHLINCTSVGMGNDTNLPIPAEALLEKKLVMDAISNPEWTSLLHAAQKKECAVVTGKDMFIQQAIEQFCIWFKE